MKVCFIAGTLDRGGAERQLVYMLRALQGEGINTRVLCLTKGEAYEREIEKLGIEVEWIGYSRSRLMRLLKIVTNIRTRPVDLVQSSHFYTNIYAGAAGRILGIPTIGAIRSDLAHEFATNRTYGTWQLRLPGHLISNSALAMRRAVARGVSQQNIDLLKNVVDTDANRKDQARDLSNNVSILFAGRLTKEKRPEVFVKLASRLIQDLPQRKLSFRIAGDGPLRGRLERLVSEAGLSKKVFSFAGTQTEMDSVYRQADILVVTSAHEGTPNVVLEAMAYGIPVVATTVGGVPEVLNSECGILVDPSDLNGLFLATAGLIQDPELRRRFGESGREYVATQHSLGSLGDRLTQIYSKLVVDQHQNG